MIMVKPVKKRGRPTLYRAMYAKMAYAFCLLGMDDNGLAEMFEVDEVTINRWKQAHPEFRKSITRGKEPADAEVAAATFRSATGQHFIEEERALSDGNGGVQIVSVRRQLPPEPQAQRMWLFNRQPHLWKNKVEVKEDVNLHVFPPAEVLDAIYTKALAEAAQRETLLAGRMERLGLVLDGYEGNC